MTTRGGTAGGLSTTDIDRIRHNLATGRRPKVVFTSSAGQMAGQPGQVVKLADPDHTGDWLVVRFGHDELPFSPADLSLPTRARPTGRTGNGRRPQPDALLPAPASAGPEGGTGPATAAGRALRPAARGAPPPATGEVPPAAPRRPVKRAARPATPRPPASMIVTLAYQAGEWTVTAHQGSRTLAKPCLVRPAEALKMVAMLDVPGVHDAVEQIVTAELTEVQRRAETLRSELAAVEARLAELRDAG
jgi:hypothetical protein